MESFPVNDSVYSELLAGLCSLENGPWVAGGSVRKVWQGKLWRYQDVDFFFNNEQQFSSFNDKIVMGKLGSVIGLPLNTTNATTYTLQYKEVGLIKIQAIRKQWYNSYEQILKDFDFNISQFVTDGNIIMATAAAIDGCNNNSVKWNTESVRTLKALRLLKYTVYGFNPDKELLINAAKIFINGDIGDHDEY